MVLLLLVYSLCQWSDSELPLAVASLSILSIHTNLIMMVSNNKVLSEIWVANGRSWTERQRKYIQVLSKSNISRNNYRTEPYVAAGEKLSMICRSILLEYPGPYQWPIINVDHELCRLVSQTTPSEKRSSSVLWMDHVTFDILYWSIQSSIPSIHSTTEKELNKNLNSFLQSFYLKKFPSNMA